MISLSCSSHHCRLFFLSARSPIRMLTNPRKSFMIGSTSSIVISRDSLIDFFENNTAKHQNRQEVRIRTVGGGRAGRAVQTVAEKHQTPEGFSRVSRVGTVGNNQVQ